MPAPDSSGFAFHEGELAVQARVGTVDSAAMDSLYIRPYMPEQHREFYQEQNMLYVGGEDEEGRVWASVLVGEPGFMRSDSPKHLAIAGGAALPSDPLAFKPGSALGGLAMDLSVRRRNRVAGTVTALGVGGELQLHCEQTTGNCPKYITIRDVRLDPARLAAVQRGQAPTGVLDSSGPLGERQLAMIRAADIFFLATSAHRPGAAAGALHSGRSSQPHLGCDVSHRGGPPGFVEAAEDGRTLRWPDYSGNNFFMSLGNVQLNPAAGLLFVDWLTGDVLQLSGAAEVLFDDRSLPGAQRVVRFATERWHYAPGALPVLPAPALQYSPHNPQPAGGQDGGGEAVLCMGVRDEADGIKTFIFKAPPGFSHAAGQYASFDFAGLGAGGETLNRTWTISSHPAESAACARFCISVKRAGLVSGWLHDRLAPGAALRLRGVGGDFVVQAGSTRPLLLLAGGIGITPLRAMFLEAVQRGLPAALLYSVRHPGEAAFLADLAHLARQASAAAPAAPDGGPAYRVLATATAAGGPSGEEGWRSGRISAAMVREAVGDAASRDAYVCGPTAFMEAQTRLLEGLGVPPARIHTESFTF